MTRTRVLLRADEFKRLERKHPRSEGSASIGKRALAIAKIHLRRKHPDCRFATWRTGADLAVRYRLDTRLQLLEVKGTSEAGVAWQQLKVSGVPSQRLLTEASIPLLRVSRVFDRCPVVYTLLHGQDFNLVPEPRWRLVRKRGQNYRMPATAGGAMVLRSHDGRSPAAPDVERAIMPMTSVKKKVREAEFFLGKLQECDRIAFGDHEHFDFFLSAFLNAAHSVDYRLRHSYAARYKAFYEQVWIRGLAPEQQRLLKFMADDRNLEVHEAGSGRSEGEERIPVRSRYDNGSGSMTVFGPPGAPPAEIVKATYTFQIDGRVVPVVNCCREYLRLLEQLVDEFGRHLGIA